MGEGFNVNLVMLCFLVLALSVKDLVFISPGTVEQAELESPSVEPVSDVQSEMPDQAETDGESENFDTNFGDEDVQKKIPSLKMKSNQQTIKFLYCFSCGYKNAFEQYSQLIQSRFPDINIAGENYSPGTHRLIMAQALSVLKMVLIGFIISGSSPFAYFNMASPSVFTWATQNKFYSCLMIFFLSNAIETSLISSGAFEIYLNGIQIWSKLASERMPHDKELMQILDINFNFESEKNSAFGTGSANGKF
ncbi:seleno T [Brachionus plicatilis]|uniref:Seleno T n=1 Tax=Brachionus plicatilis TaxID=10195 RepID=A0A3M7PMA1_BRAPC|nr:seleno T [Brachionus plicatilis]